MAWVEQKPNGTFHIVFRLGEEKYRRSLRTKNRKAAAAQCARLDETLQFVESGRLVIPDDADTVSFLLSDGKLNGTATRQKRLTLGQAFSVYERSLPKTRARKPVTIVCNSQRSPLAFVHRRQSPDPGFARSILFLFCPSRPRFSQTSCE